MASLVSVVLPSSGNWSSLARSQLEVLQSLVKKHLEDPSLTDIASADDFALTSTERGIPRYEHSHLVAALDVILEYQRNRKTTYFTVLGTRAQTSIGTYRHDPRTRLIELLKRWLRTHAANPNITEDEVRRMCGLCRDLLNYPNLFPSRNKTSFMHALSEVYEHMELQLRQVLERDRTCAELAARCLSLSRNLISDVVAFLLLAATHLTQTDSLPSLEVVVLWQSLPTSRSPLPSRADPQLQKAMQDAWQTMIGSLVVNLLSLRWTSHLFAGNGAEEEMLQLAHAAPEGSTALAESPSESLLAQVRRVREEFEAGHFKTSGLAGPFREASQQDARENLLIAVESLFDLLYLIGEVLSQFHRISDSLGDYGMIRVALWLHPCLDSMVEKLQRLQGSLKGLNRAVDSELVIAKARGRSLKKPLPSERMSARGHAAIQRALDGRDCHLTALLQSLEELKSHSSPERLPHVMEGLGDACLQLQNVLSSAQFRARVGDAFPRLPPLANMGRASSRPALQLENNAGIEDDAPMGDYSEPEEDQATSACIPSYGARCGPGRGRTYSPRQMASQAKDTTAVAVSLPLPDGSREDSPEKLAFQSCLFFAQGSSRRSGSVPAAIRATWRAFCGLKEPAMLPVSAAPPALPGPPDSSMPADLVTNLPNDGWISHTGPGGRTSWHHKSLGPAPWEGRPMEDHPTPASAASALTVADANTLGSSREQRRDTNPFSEDLGQDRVDADTGRSSQAHRTSARDVDALSPLSFGVDRRSTSATLIGADSNMSLPRDKDSIRTLSTELTPASMPQVAPPRHMPEFPDTPSTGSRLLGASAATGKMVPGDGHHGQEPHVVGSGKAPATPLASLSKGSLRAEVHRLTTGVQGWKRHDSRSLFITGSQLLIYEKGSTDQVKTVVDIGAGEVERCCLVGTGIMSLQVQRKKRRSSSLGRFTSPRRSGAARSEAREQKLYFFEFDDAAAARELLGRPTTLVNGCACGSCRQSVSTMYRPEEVLRCALQFAASAEQMMDEKHLRDVGFSAVRCNLCNGEIKAGFFVVVMQCKHTFHKEESKPDTRRPREPVPVSEPTTREEWCLGCELKIGFLDISGHFQLTGSGAIYYYNTKTGVSQNEAGEATDVSGARFYVPIHLVEAAWCSTVKLDGGGAADFTTTPDGLKILDLAPGKGDECCAQDDIVLVDWSLRRSNGYFVDASFGFDPGRGIDEKFGVGSPELRFSPVGDKGDKVIEGVKKALIGMRVGGTRRVIVPPKLGFVSGELAPKPNDWGRQRQIERFKNKNWVIELRLKALRK
ncbi:FKBP16-1 [Symbiodinium pilosum]|uniref:peptidylprolyl isomerase n=1 Tax=Symbiodinium pilosum TaxID=2952 RepID=A0A812JWW9_SYMPI|nr:FKBP16-1 [Symbiodinium pilosum]